MKIFHRNNFSIGEQVRLSRRMSALLGAGISIAEALTFIERSLPKKKKKIIAKIIEGISHGQTCSEVFTSASIFDRSLLHMITIGEKSGSLETAFLHSAELLEKRENLSRKIYGALVYPAFIACATIGIAIFLVVYIFPKIIPLVTSMNIPLPFLTRILMWVSYALIHYWLTIILTIVSICTLFFLLWKYARPFRIAIGIATMALPVVGSIFRGRTLVTIFRPLGLLVGQGEHIPEALISISGIISNDEYRVALSEAASKVTRGGSLSEYIAECNGVNGNGGMNEGGGDRATDLFPQLVIDFLETGERTGGVAVACEHIAKLYESETDESVKSISTIIEPALMLCMGFIVGGIALSIVMPIYEITSHLSK